MNQGSGGSNTRKGFPDPLFGHFFPNNKDLMFSIRFLG